MKRWFIFPVVLIVLAGVAGAAYLGYRGSQPAQPAALVAPPTVPVTRGDVQQVVTAPGQLAGARETMLSLGVAGRLTALPVRTGDHVRAGDLLAQIDDADLQLALQAAQASQAAAQARITQLKSPPGEADVHAAQAQVDSAQAAYQAALGRSAHASDQLAAVSAQLQKATIAVQQAQQAYDQISWRGDVGMTPQAAALQQATIDYEAAKAAYNLAADGINDSGVKAAAQGVAQAQAALVKLQAPAATGDMAAAQAQADAARVAVEQAQARLNQTRLTAPYDGIVLEVKAAEGEAVTAGQGLVRLADPQALEARVTAVEEDFPLLQVGQPVELFFDARPDLSVTGHVSRLVPARDSGTTPQYPIYITLDEVPDGLADGMTVDASVQIAQRKGVLRLPRALARARSDNSALVKIWNGTAIEDRTVQVGLRGNQYVEILSGLREGDAVVSR